MLKAVDLMFRELCAADPVLEQFRKVKVRHYERETPKLLQSCTMDVHGFGCEPGGQVSVSLWTGHPFPEVTPCFYDSRGFYLLHHNLPNQLTGESWWPVNRVDDLDSARKGIASSLREVGGPWFQQVSSPEGFLDYAKNQIPVGQWMVIDYFINGLESLRGVFSSWLRELPRDNAKKLLWVASTGLISEEECASLSRASLQDQTTYERQVTDFLDRWDN